MYKKKVVPSDKELTIISFMIMRTEVLAFFYNKYKDGEIRTKHFGEYFRPIIRWLIMYYSEYKRAPKKMISQVFKEKSKSLGDAVELVEEYLYEASELYGKMEEEAFDSEYIIKEVLVNFIKEQETNLLIEKLSDRLDKGQPENVDKVINEYKTISSEADTDALEADIPYSKEAILEYRDYQKIGGDALFRIDGPLGQLIGDISKKKFYAITGVEKAGKTRFMIDLAYTASMVFGLKVLWINLEMPKDDIREIFWQILTGCVAEKEYATRLTYPVFDCLNNQLCRCEVRKTQVNRNKLFSTTSERPTPFEENRSWKICTKCRGDKRKRYKKTKRFIPAIWFEKSSRFYMLSASKTLKVLKSDISKIRKFKNIRVKTFPRLSATLMEVIDFIENYTKKHSWRPHIVFFDYLDILAPQKGALLDRQNVDFIWKRAGGLAQELDCAIITADQAVKAARNKRSLGQGDTSESKTKDAHIDMRITLNMTEEEQELGLQRIGVIFRRKGRIYQSQVMALQRRETAESVLDTEWWTGAGSTYSVKK